MKDYLEGISVSEKPQFGEIGELIYLRTYSRWSEENNRREKWGETVKRTVNWSGSLVDNFPEQEAKELFDNWNNLRAFPSGRSLWTAGTEFSKNHGFGNFNCAFSEMLSPQDFYELVYLLMNGCGVGFRVTRDNIQKLSEKYPLVDHTIGLTVEPYNYVGTPKQLEHTIVKRDVSILKITVGDSREGWSEAVREYIAAVTGQYGDIRRIIIRVDFIRKFGEPLGQFGGYASGPQPMIDFFNDAHRVLFSDNRGWTSLKVHDLCCMTGRMVVSGGSRRSSLISLGDYDDPEFINAKTGNWHEKYPWRSQANNSVIFPEKPDSDTLKNIFELIAEYGEPGFINEQSAKQRRDDFRGVNPCVEVLLGTDNDGKGLGLCNLVTTNLMAFVKDGKIDYESLDRTTKLQARHNLRVTNVKLEIGNWNDVQKRDRLLGMSFTGFGDLIDALNLSSERQKQLLLRLNKVSRSEADNYAQEIGISKSRLVTTLKPEGSITNLPGVSSGIHNNFGPYYIRRVRISEADAVAQSLIQQGYSYEHDVFNHNTLVFSFPISTPAKKYAYEYSAIDMLERYKMAMTNYVEHNCSITVYFEEQEIDDIVNWLLKNWEHYVAVSFLKKSDDSYPQMPYERITKDQFNKMKAETKDYDRSVLDAIENKGMVATDDLENECSGNSCPIR